jgi:hypothetical protein
MIVSSKEREKLLVFSPRVFCILLRVYLCKNIIIYVKGTYLQVSGARRLDPDCGQECAELALPVLPTCLIPPPRSGHHAHSPDDHADGDEEVEHDDGDVSLPCRMEQSEEEHESDEDVEKLAVHGSLL